MKRSNQPGLNVNLCGRFPSLRSRIKQAAQYRLCVPCFHVAYAFALSQNLCLLLPQDCSEENVLFYCLFKLAKGLRELCGDGVCNRVISVEWI